ncbi:MAG: HEPN domain-containing protein [Chitinophagaceae bacterium]
MEKCLKAFLTYHGRDINRTHNVIFLLSECSNFDSIFATIDPLNINPYAVQGRYPDSNLMPTSEEAKSFYQLALQIRLCSLKGLFSPHHFYFPCKAYTIM